MTAEDLGVYAPLTCPMPGCEEQLAVRWTATYVLTVGDTYEDEKAPAVEDAEATTWRVECLDGHVVLLPGALGCGCEDPGGESCPPEHMDDFDHSEEHRDLRAPDVARLLQLFDLLNL